MASILQEIVNLLVGGISGIASGIGSGLQELVKSIFLDGSGTNESPYTLSVYGGLIAVFGGVALAVGLSTRILMWLESFGK